MFQDNIQDEDSDDAMYSDDSYSEEKLYNPGEIESVKEVFGFESKDDENSDENEEISAESNFDLPDTRAWGKKKKIYYASDYIDTDLKTLTEKDEQNAALEEEEAKNIQKRLAKELDDVDFGLNVGVLSNQVESKLSTSHVIKVDTSKFTSRQKLELLEKESPEFLTLIQDIKDQLSEVKTNLGPYLKLMKKENALNNAELMSAQAKYQVLLNYCLNILFYLTLKAKRSFVNTHPVIKRLAQYRQLLNQISSTQGQISMKETTSVLSKEKKKKKFIGDKNLKEEIDEESVDNMSDNEVTEQQDRRMITYQISKNKGLTPHRSKEQRNPRVKHRNKYRKAKIRRKGAVREARKEIHRYGGEISGIKVGLKKSIPLK